MDNIGCTRDYIVGLGKGLEEKALAVANTLKKEIEKS